jgi:hypothetical protein
MGSCEEVSEITIQRKHGKHYLSRSISSADLRLKLSLGQLIVEHVRISSVHNFRSDNASIPFLTSSRPVSPSGLTLHMSGLTLHISCSHLLSTSYRFALVCFGFRQPRFSDLDSPFASLGRARRTDHDHCWGRAHGCFCSLQEQWLRMAKSLRPTGRCLRLRGLIHWRMRIALAREWRRYGRMPTTSHSGGPWHSVSSCRLGRRRG